MFCFWAPRGTGLYRFFGDLGNHVSRSIFYLFPLLFFPHPVKARKPWCLQSTANISENKSQWVYTKVIKWGTILILCPKQWRDPVALLGLLTWPDPLVTTKKRATINKHQVAQGASPSIKHFPPDRNNLFMVQWLKYRYYLERATGFTATSNT